VITALVVILAGAVWVLRPLGMGTMVLAFLIPFAALSGIEALSGSCFLAGWHSGPVCGWDYWLNLVTSPELLVFTFFMISDPRTAPRGQDARIVYGVAIALLASGLLVLQPSEFGVKLAILAALTAVCALVPVMDRVLAMQKMTLPKIGWKSGAAAVATALIAVAVPVAVIALASDQLVVAIDSRGSSSAPVIRGLSPADIPQQ
jgi:Na+-translocating ferredoxin:NAD+ oxidoreductase RnfD subunit/Flp pilus assembly pilin Flp